MTSLVLPTRTSCPECLSVDIITDIAAGDVVCRGCGIVLQDSVLCETQEWRVFAGEEGKGDERSRVGGSLDPRSVSGGVVTITRGGRNAEETKALRKGGAIASTETRADKALIRCLDRVREIADILGITSEIRGTAESVLQTANDAGIFTRKTGTSAEAMCAACIYLACRQHGAARALAEVAPAAGVSKKDVAKRFRSLDRNLGAEISRGCVRAEDLVPRLCGVLGLDASVTQVVRHVASLAGELGILGGVQPAAGAAAAVVLGGGGVGALYGVSAEEVVDGCGTTHGAMAAAYAKIYPFRVQLFPDHLRARLKEVEEGPQGLPSEL